MVQIDQTSARTSICNECEREHNGSVAVKVEGGDDGAPLHSFTSLFHGWLNDYLHTEKNW